MIIHEPILTCYILDSGRMVVGQSANLEEKSYLEIEGGREKKVSQRYLYVQDGIFIEQAKLGNFDNFEKLRNDTNFKKKIIKEYINSEDKEDRVIHDVYTIIKPYTLFYDKNSFYEKTKRKEELDDILAIKEI